MATSIINNVMDGIVYAEDLHTNWRVRKWGIMCILEWWGTGFTMSSDGYTVEGTIAEGFRPYSYSRMVTKVYDGSSYVDCVVAVSTSGVITIRNLLGGAISGISTRYLQMNPIVFYTMK